jgi:RimJ/RimL family protein N-acetyltransferase
MRVDRNDLTMRSITGPEELDLFCRLSYVLDGELAEDLAAGRRRPDWMWVALHGDRLVARAAWWGREKNSDPLVLDVFDINDDSDDPSRIDIGVWLLETALADVISSDVRPPDYIRFIPPDWRDNDNARQIIEDRMAALEQVGARLLVERLRLEWRSGTPIPALSARLAFRPVADRAELVELMTLVLDGTLDAHSREALSRGSPGQAAAEQYDGEFMSYSSPRDWWRVATLPDSEPVGFVIPARNDYNPIIAYIAVLPQHRGRGYIDDLLAEGTRTLAANNAPRIRASTDLANVPMANAFQRAGYAVYQRQIDMTWARER